MSVNLRFIAAAIALSLVWASGPSLSAGQASPRLYVIDSGVNLPAVTDGPDFTGGSGRDGNGHGTAVASIARSIGGQMPITSVRVFTDSGEGNSSLTLDGIAWVYADFLARGGPAVALLAVGGSPVYGGGHQTELDAEAIIDASLTDGLTWVIGAGNDNDWVGNYARARLDRPIVVGATDGGTARAWYSNFGPQVDLFANGAFGIGGTSAASAQVAGGAVNVLKLYPWAPPLHVRNVLVESAPEAMTAPGPATTYRLFGGF